MLFCRGSSTCPWILVGFSFLTKHSFLGGVTIWMPQQFELVIKLYLATKVIVNALFETSLECSLFLLACIYMLDYTYIVFLGVAFSLHFCNQSGGKSAKCLGYYSIFGLWIKMIHSVLFSCCPSVFPLAEINSSFSLVWTEGGFLFSVVSMGHIVYILLNCKLSLFKATCSSGIVV